MATKRKQATKGRRMDKAPKRAARADNDAADTGERDAAIQRLNANFTRNVPRAAQSSGAHEVEREDLREAEKLPVPDGSYRVLGSDWVHSFKGGKHVASERAGPHTDPDEIVTVPPPANT